MFWGFEEGDGAEVGGWGGGVEEGVDGLCGLGEEVRMGFVCVRLGFGG